MFNNMEFFQENRNDWINIHERIFPLGIPQKCEWIDLQSIASILDTIGSTDNSNHMFYPTGGGLDIESAKLSNEKGCIEIFTGITDIIKPKRLLFESFDDPIWNYFRIESFE